MDWSGITQLILAIFGSGGVITLGIAVFKARPEKISYEIKNLREVIEILKTEREEDKQEALKERQALERRLGEIEITNSVLQKAIQQWVGCVHLPKGGACPVASFVDEAGNLIQKRVEALRQSKKDK